MQLQLSPSHTLPGVWRIEGIDYESDGEIYSVVFSGPNAEERAREYLSWKQPNAIQAQEAA